MRTRSVQRFPPAGAGRLVGSLPPLPPRGGARPPRGDDDPPLQPRPTGARAEHGATASRTAAPPRSAACASQPRRPEEPGRCVQRTGAPGQQTGSMQITLNQHPATGIVITASSDGRSPGPGIAAQFQRERRRPPPRPASAPSRRQFHAARAGAPALGRRRPRDRACPRECGPPRGSGCRSTTQPVKSTSSTRRSGSPALTVPQDTASPGRRPRAEQLPSQIGSPARRRELETRAADHAKCCEPRGRQGPASCGARSAPSRAPRHQHQFLRAGHGEGGGPTSSARAERPASASCWTSSRRLLGGSSHAGPAQCMAQEQLPRPAGGRPSRRPRGVHAQRTMAVSGSPASASGAAARTAGRRRTSVTVGGAREGSGRVDAVSGVRGPGADTTSLAGRMPERFAA